MAQQHRYRALSTDEREQITTLIKRVEARRFWRRLRPIEEAILAQAHQVLAQHAASCSSGRAFPRNSESAKRRARRHCRKAHR